MASKIVLDRIAIKKIDRKVQVALEKTTEAMKTEVVISQVMPFDTGTLQNNSTFVDSSDLERGVCRIVSNTPYARRLYYHPEYNFSKIENPNAGGKWFEMFITGNKQNFPQKTFAKFLKGMM